jgi:toxin ParE1/3/4
MRVLRIHAAAAEEAAEAVAWYEKEHIGLGSEFERAVDAALDLLEQDIVPLTSARGMAGNRGVKRLLLRRFPYSVIVLERTAEFVVIAFAHHARRPGYWRDRLRTWPA